MESSKTIENNNDKAEKQAVPTGNVSIDRKTDRQTDRPPTVIYWAPGEETLTTQYGGAHTFLWPRRLGSRGAASDRPLHDTSTGQSGGQTG